MIRAEKISMEFNEELLGEILVDLEKLSNVNAICIIETKIRKKTDKQPSKETSRVVTYLLYTLTV